MTTVWPTVRIADVCERIDYGFTAPATNEPVGPRFLRITDIVRGPIDWATVPHCEASAIATSRFALSDGDIVIARTGATTGASAYVKEPPASVFASYLVRLRARRGVDSRFLAYFLQSDQYWTYVRGVLGDKSAQPNASAKTLTQARLRLPPYEEQSAISGVLGALDDKIELNRRMNETAEDIADLAFIEASRGAPMAPLSSVARTKRDSIDPRTEPDELFEHFSIPAFDDGHRPVVERGAGIRSAKFVIPNGAVLVSKLNPRIPRVWLPDLRNLRRPVCSTEFVVLEPAADSSSAYLYMLLRSEPFREELASRVTGTSGSHQRVRPDDMLSIDVPAVDITSRRQLDDISQPLLARVAANERESRTLADLRDTLLPKLISGELRVRDAEAAVESAGL